MSMKRPKGCRFWTGVDVARWIMANTGTRTLAKAQDAVLWWQACETAESISDMNHKERAHLLLEGSKPISLADVARDLQGPHEDGEATTEQLDEYVEERLRTHFGADIQEQLRSTPEGA